MALWRKNAHPNRDDVAIILAFGLCVAVGTIAVAVMWDAISHEGPGLTENATQVLTTALAGMIGLLGGYLGGRHRPAEPSGLPQDDVSLHGDGENG